MTTHQRLVLCIVMLLSCQSTGLSAAEPQVVWKQSGKLAAPEAHQAAAADDKFVYAITNTLVAKYDRQSGQRLATSTGEAKHLNS